MRLKLIPTVNFDSIKYTVRFWTITLRMPAYLPNDAKKKNEMEVMVLTGLANICKKLADNPVLPDELRTQAREFREAYDSLVPHKGNGNLAEHLRGEELLTKIARFLPRVLEGRGSLIR